MFIIITGIFCSSEEWKDIRNYDGAPHEKLFCSKSNILLNTPLKYKEKEEIATVIDSSHNYDLIMVINSELKENLIIKGNITLIKNVLPVAAQSLDDIDIYMIFDHKFITIAS